ncbi:lytic transglycosylase domain-containing protein [Aquidulcibacter paucihalophilus]|uniref:lytic transglycosylase domain-containing protein n=1 Tax=Aquidulcibacter paucihalophilus TaxID=1978549 RepID=UPI000A18D5DA|nr:lytic transglycosylase domain-containing protein [Aquidulcibacter paucihalophilus]
MDFQRLSSTSAKGLDGLTQSDVTQIGGLKRAFVRPILVASCLGFACLSTAAFAQTTAPPVALRGTVAGPDILSSSDEANYRKAFAAATAHQKAVLEAVLPSISDGTLKPHVERARLISPAAPPDLPAMAAWLERWGDVAGASAVYERAQAAQEDAIQAARIMGVVPTPFRLKRPDPVPTRRSMGVVREPSFIPVPIGQGATRAHRAQIDTLAARFYVGDDETALAMAREAVTGPQSGQAGWIGGLAAYRLGDFATAQTMFTAAANWNASDDWARSAGAFWAARASEKLGDKGRTQSFLEQAASNPLTFYGQLALARLGRWDTLRIPQAQDERDRAARLMRTDPGVRRAAALKEVGRLSDAEAELFNSWSRARAEDDLGYLAVARSLNLDPVAERIAQSSSAAALAALYPVPDQFRPVGGEFVLDRAVVLAVMRQESKFDTDAKSYAGARGLMQVMPRTAAWMTGRRDLASNPRLLNDTTLNVTLGEAYLEKMMAMGVVSNCLTRTFMAYNAGPGNVTRWSASVKGAEDTLMFMEAAPNGQARVYAERVMSNMWIYHRRFGQRAPSLEKLARGLPPTYEPQDNPRLASANVRLGSITPGGATGATGSAGLASTGVLSLR